MCRKQLPPLFRRISSSTKGLKLTSAQLLAKNPRFELTLNLKSDMINVVDYYEQLSELREQSHKDILNSIDIKESMRIVRSLLHTTSLLNEDDASSLRTKVSTTIKSLEWKKEKHSKNDSCCNLV